MAGKPSLESWSTALSAQTESLKLTPAPQVQQVQLWFGCRGFLLGCVGAVCCQRWRRRRCGNNNSLRRGLCRIRVDDCRFGTGRRTRCGACRRRSKSTLRSAVIRGCRRPDRPGQRFCALGRFCRRHRDCGLVHCRCGRTGCGIRTSIEIDLSLSSQRRAREAGPQLPWRTLSPLNFEQRLHSQFLPERSWDQPEACTLSDGRRLAGGLSRVSLFSLNFQSEGHGRAH